MIAIAVLSSSLSARVWHIRDDGSGDAPTIQAGIDSCSSADTVLIAPGYYTDPGNMDIDFKGKSIVVTSEAGPDSTTVFGFLTSAFNFHSGEDSTSIVQGLFIESVWGNTISIDSSSPKITGNRIHNNTYEACIYCENSSAMICENELRASENGGICIKSLNDSSTILNNSFAGNDYSPCIQCDSSCVEIIGNSTEWGRWGIFVTYGSYSIIDNEIIHPYCEKINIEVSDRYEYIPPSPGAGIEVIGATTTIENNILSRGGNRGISLTGGSHYIHGNEVKYFGGIYHAAGIYCTDLDSTTTIGNNSISYIESMEGSPGIYCENSSPLITGNIISGSLSSGDCSGIHCVNSSPYITGNTITNTTMVNSGHAVILCENSSSPVIEKCIIAGNHFDTGENCSAIFTADSTSLPLVQCCDVYDNEADNYGGYLTDQTGISGNISADPIFCDPGGKVYSIHAESPCAPGNHPEYTDCGLIGALGVDCYFVSALLQSHSASFDKEAIIIEWKLSEQYGEEEFKIFRAKSPAEFYSVMENPGITKEGLTYTIHDKDIDPGSSYRYRVEINDDGLPSLLFETDLIATPSIPLVLYQNYPNPFNPETKIRYYLPEKSMVSLEIFDVSGKKIKTLVSEIQDKGSKEYFWNGINSRGAEISSGIYLYKLRAGKKVLTKKMVLLR